MLEFVHSICIYANRLIISENHNIAVMNINIRILYVEDFGNLHI